MDEVDLVHLTIGDPFSRVVLLLGL
jgi:hypothetical protein